MNIAYRGIRLARVLSGPERGSLAVRLDLVENVGERGGIVQAALYGDDPPLVETINTIKLRIYAACSHSNRVQIVGCPSDPVYLLSLLDQIGDAGYSVAIEASGGPLAAFKDLADVSIDPPAPDATGAILAGPVGKE